MERFEIYEDIKTRSNGDIYVGVVGPVRCGKSMFISNFMKSLVIPNIASKQSQERAIDELPQSAEGKTIMTTQPKFVPSEAVEINVGNVNMNVRLVDCVGFLTKDSLGHMENDKPRLVKTPWSNDEMPFEKAAEIGTKKVITEHSTFGVVMTTDGSITDLDRNGYVEAEEKVIAEMKNTGKPFVVVVNSTDPESKETLNLEKALKEKYDVSTCCVDVKNMTSQDVENIFTKVLEEFPLKSLKIKLPEYLQALDYTDELIKTIINEVMKFGNDISKIGGLDKTMVGFLDSEDFEPLTIGEIKLGEGVANFEVAAKPCLFYKVLSNQCGAEIKNDFELVSYIKDLAHAKVEYDKIQSALNDVDENGYGIVVPTLHDMVLEEPKLVRQGNKHSVQIKATAPSLHIMKVDVETEINPLVGSEEQCKDLLNYLQVEYEEKQDGIWNTNMFGKTLHDYVSEGMNGKVKAMPVEARKKMRKTLSRIVNEGKGGIICILL